MAGALRIWNGLRLSITRRLSPLERRKAFKRSMREKKTKCFGCSSEKTTTPMLTIGSGKHCRRSKVIFKTFAFGELPGLKRRPRFGLYTVNLRETLILYQVKELRPLLAGEDVSSIISVIYLAFEVFVLVGARLRGRRKEIRLALEFAKVGRSIIGLYHGVLLLCPIQANINTRCETKPFQPPVHVLIFPSRIPVELRATLRGLEEQALVSSGTRLY